jgi:hypothetical protein
MRVIAALLLLICASLVSANEADDSELVSLLVDLDERAPTPVIVGRPAPTTKRPIRAGMPALTTREPETARPIRAGMPALTTRRFVTFLGRPAHTTRRPIRLGKPARTTQVPVPRRVIMGKMVATTKQPIVDQEEIELDEIVEALAPATTRKPVRKTTKRFFGKPARTTATTTIATTQESVEEVELNDVVESGASDEESQTQQVQEAVQQQQVSKQTVVEAAPVVFVDVGATQFPPRRSSLEVK